MSAIVNQRLTLLGNGSYPPGGTINGLNGQTIVGNANGAWAVTANGTNQSITHTPSGTGSVIFQFADTKLTFNEDTASANTPGLWILPTATAISSSNYTLVATAATTFLNAGTGITFSVGGTGQGSVSSGAFAMTGTITGTRTALAATPTDGIITQNTTAATGGATVQMSPRLRFRGHAWDTAASQSLDFTIQMLPVTGATPSSILQFSHSLNGAAYTVPMTLTSAGLLTILGSLVSSGNITSAAGGIHTWLGRSAMFSDADGNIRLTNASQNAFTMLQFGLTSSSAPGLKRVTTELEAKLADDSAYTYIKAKLRASNGTAGANFGPAAVASITVVDGVITAIS